MLPSRRQFDSTPLSTSVEDAELPSQSNLRFSNHPLEFYVCILVIMYAKQASSVVFYNQYQIYQRSPTSV